MIMFQSLSKLAASLITNDQPNNYQEVADSWLAALFVIVVVSTIVLIVYQWSRKRMDPRRRQWGRVKILWLMLVGLGLTMISVVVTYNVSLDFQTVVGTPGLYKGIVVCWIMYAVLFLAGHLAVPDLRRDLFGF
jgi:membrane protease YdiL (CAAX protease family)